MSTPVAIEEVPGLFVQTEFFSPDIERSLYHDRTLFPVSASALSQDGHRQGGHIFAAFASPDRIPDNLIKVCNGITESGLFEDLIAPDYVFPLNYVDKANVSNKHTICTHKLSFHANISTHHPSLSLPV